VTIRHELGHNYYQRAYRLTGALEGTRAALSSNVPAGAAFAESGCPPTGPPLHRIADWQVKVEEKVTHIMAYDEQLAERVRRCFGAAAVHFEEKCMMGGLCFMVDGKMCVGVEKERLMARIGPDAYEEALRGKGCVPMDFTGRPLRGFVFVNLEGLKTEAELKSWIKLALSFNPEAKPSKSRARASKPRPIRAM
jgi:hypothetical protein